MYLAKYNFGTACCFCNLLKLALSQNVLLKGKVHKPLNLQLPFGEREGVCDTAGQARVGVICIVGRGFLSWQLIWLNKAIIHSKISWSKNWIHFPVQRFNSTQFKYPQVCSTNTNYIRFFWFPGVLLTFYHKLLSPLDLVQYFKHLKKIWNSLMYKGLAWCRHLSREV